MLTKPSLNKLVLRGTVVCLLTLTTSVSVAQETLSSAELSGMLSGKTWVVSSQGSNQISITWKSDGSYCLDAGGAGENQSRSQCGTWRQEEDKFCMETPNQGPERCLRVAKSGRESFDALNDDGNADFSWSMSR